MESKHIALIVIALILVGLAPVGCTMHRQRLIAEAIKGGADPISVKCAIESTEDSSRSSVLCMAKALKN
jgi:hypothetical protein